MWSGFWSLRNSAEALANAWVKPHNVKRCEGMVLLPMRPSQHSHPKFSRPTLCAAVKSRTRSLGSVEGGHEGALGVHPHKERSSSGHAKPSQYARRTAAVASASADPVRGPPRSPAAGEGLGAPPALLGLAPGTALARGSAKTSIAPGEGLRGRACAFAAAGEGLGTEEPDPSALPAAGEGLGPVAAPSICEERAPVFLAAHHPRCTVSLTSVNMASPNS